MLQVAVRKQRGDFKLEVSFEAPPQSVVALFGPSGCGKTTVVNLIAGLLEPDAGCIQLDRNKLCDTTLRYSVPAEHRRIGYVFQDARLLPHLDVRGNLRYGMVRNRVEGQRIDFDEVVSLLGLEALLARRPHGLSGGERQRVALGRALLSQPRLLLLDEPLASLDAARRDEVLPYLERLRDHWKIPMVYVSHQFDEVVRLATHVVVLEHGQVTAAGPLSQVSLNPALGRVIGVAGVGSVLDSTVTSSDTASGLCRVSAGNGELRLLAEGLLPGARIRLQVLARDVIIATQAPQGLSVRNVLAGTVAAVNAESPQSDLVSIDVGGVILLARVTHAATRELAIIAGQHVWALVKAVSLRGRAF